MKKSKGRVIDAKRLRVNDQSVRVSATAATKSPNHERAASGEHQSMEVIPSRETDGAVRSIQVRCPCGNETVIECIFEGEESFANQNV